MSASADPRAIGLYGGSFDPPHVAHVMTVAWALSTLPIDQVWVLPVAFHPFGKALSPYELRLEMCRRAFGCFGKAVAVSAVEQQLGPVNRTIDTLLHLRRAHPDCRFCLIFGADVLGERHQWKQFDELERLVPIHFIGRAGQLPPTGTLVAPCLPDISSTHIRQSLREGIAVAGVVPRAVLQLIEEQRLYR